MKRVVKSVLTVVSVACMFLLLGLAGGSDAGTVSAGQALAGGTLAMVGCIGCAWGAERLGEKQHE